MAYVCRAGKEPNLNQMLYLFLSLTIYSSKKNLEKKNKKQNQATEYFTLRIGLFHLTEAFCITHHWHI